MATQTARGGNQALAVLGQYIPVDSGLVVVPLHEGPAGHLDQVPVAHVVLRQQGEVVHQLAAAIRLATRVVNSASSRRALETGVMGHVCLGAQNRLDPTVAAGPVEVQDPVHVPVVGDPERRLAVGHRSVHQLADPGCPVQHRELGMDVEVGETGSHRVAPLTGKCRAESPARRPILRTAAPGVASRPTAAGRPSAGRTGWPGSPG